MMNKTLQRHVFYLIGIVLFALIINLGSAFDDVMERLNKPLFQRIVLATTVLLYGYLYIIQKLYHRLFFTYSRFTALSNIFKGAIFMILSIGIVLSIHLLVLDILLAQGKQETLFALGYFKNDFWFFFIPLVTYVIFLLLKPETLLFKFSKKINSVIENGGQTLDKGIFEDKLLSDKEIEAVVESEDLLQVWRETRVKKLVFDYYQLLLAKEEWHLDGDIQFWKMVILEKTSHINFGYFLNGEKWALHRFDQEVFTNPWLLKISQNLFVNMLYVMEELDYRAIVDHDKKKKVSAVKKDRVEIIALYDEIRNAIEHVMDPGKLDLLLAISRRMKDKNYYNFWKETNLQKLDEKRLEDAFCSINH